MNAPIDNVRLETLQNSNPCQKTSHLVKNRAILPLAYIILLRLIGLYKLSFDAMSLIKICKFMSYNLPLISVQYFY